MWWEPVMEAVFGALGIGLTALIGWGISSLIAWLKTKIKNQEVVTAIEEILNVGSVAVQSTYQTYVEGIKGTDMWTKETQKEALKMSLETMKNSLSQGAKDWISKNFNSIDDYLIGIIESAINKNKSTNKN